MSHYTAEQIAAWREKNRRHHFHAMTSPRQHATGAEGVFLTHAKGIYLYSADGKRHIDALSGLGCVNIGYGNERVAAAAAEALRELSYQNTFFGATNRWACDLSAKIASRAPDGFENVFYANSGSEANESAIKMAWHYWRLRGKPQKKKIITRELGYHGTTIFACSITGISHYHPQFALPLKSDLIGTIGPAYYWRDGADLSPEAYAIKAAAELDEYIKRVGADNVAAFLAEPIPGAGGFMLPPPGYWAEINRICRKHDVLLIADEVVTGFGKTGEWFGCDTYGIDADLITLAKGITSAYVPLSAVLIGERAGNVLMQDDELFVHGFTNNAHPVTMATALANMEVIEEGHLVEHVHSVISPSIGEALAKLDAHPLVGETRHCGVLGAVELTPDKASRAIFSTDEMVSERVVDAAAARGLLIRPAGTSTFTFVLPMITTATEVKEIFDVATAAIDAVAEELA